MITAWLARYGLGWLVGPIAKGLLVAGGLALVVTFIREGATSAAEVKALRDQVEQSQRDLESAKEIADRSAALWAASQDELEELRKLADEIIVENRGTGDSCIVSDSLRERLRQIY